MARVKDNISSALHELSYSTIIDIGRPKGPQRATGHRLVIFDPLLLSSIRIDYTPIAGTQEQPSRRIVIFNPLASVPETRVDIRSDQAKVSQGKNGEPPKEARRLDGVTRVRSGGLHLIIDTVSDDQTARMVVDEKGNAILRRNPTDIITEEQLIALTGNPLFKRSYNEPSDTELYANVNIFEPESFIPLRLGQVIRFFRKDLGLSHEGLARRSGLKKPVIQSIEDGRIISGKSIQKTIDGIASESDIRREILQQAYEREQEAAKRRRSELWAQTHSDSAVRAKSILAEVVPEGIFPYVQLQRGDNADYTPVFDYVDDHPKAIERLPLGLLVRYYRERDLHISRKEFTEQAGVSQRTLQLLENGQSKPASERTFLGICRGFGWDTDDERMVNLRNTYTRD